MFTSWNTHNCLTTSCLHGFSTCSAESHNNLYTCIWSYYECELDNEKLINLVKDPLFTCEDWTFQFWHPKFSMYYHVTATIDSALLFGNCTTRGVFWSVLQTKLTLVEIINSTQYSQYLENYANSLHPI